MARIGSFVEGLHPRVLARRMLVTLKTEPGGNTADVGYLWSGRGGRRVSPGAWLWRHLPGTRGADAAAFGGLRDAIEAHYYTRKAINDYGGGDIGFIASPFCHFLIAGAELPSDLSAVEANLKQYFGDYFGYWGARAPRFGFLPSEDLKLVDPPGVLRVHFGFGVHVPARGEAAIGHLEAASLRDDDWADLRLDAAGALPAALYPGQLGVAFGYRPVAAPAHLNDRGIPEDYVFYFGRFSPSDAPGLGAVPRSVIDGSPQPDPLARFELDGGPNIAPEGVEMVVRSRDGPARFRLRWRGAERPDPLLPRPPGGPCLRLDGLMLPECSLRSGIARWWVDLDEVGRLATGPLGGRAYSLSNGPSGMRIYRHAGMEYDYVEAARADKPFAVADGEYRWGTVEGPRAWRWRLSPDAVLPAFGYLRLPPEARAVEGVRVGCGATQDGRGIDADWLNACAGVAVDELGPLRQGSNEALASWAFGRGRVRLHLDARDRLFMTPNRDGIAGVFTGGAFGAAGGRVRPVAAGEQVGLQPGEGVVLGCYLFYLDGT